MNGWGIHRLRDLIGRPDVFTSDGERYYRAVPEPYTGNRLKATWAVLTGRAYAIQWPKAGEFEAVMQEQSKIRDGLNLEDQP